MPLFPMYWQVNQLLWPSRVSVVLSHESMIYTVPVHIECVYMCVCVCVLVCIFNSAIVNHLLNVKYKTYSWSWIPWMYKLHELIYMLELFACLTIAWVVANQITYLAVHLVFNNNSKINKNIYIAHSQHFWKLDEAGVLF